MRKLLLSIAVAICLVLSVTSYASDISGKEYTDVPGTPTQDALVEVVVAGGLTDVIIPEAPDHRSMTVLSDIYDFVSNQNNPPATYFTEDVQTALDMVLPSGVNKESLHMSEYVLMSVSEFELPDVLVSEKFSVDYEPGQLVVVMIGQYPESGDLVEGVPLNEQIIWTPLSAVVSETGVIEYTMPENLLSSIKGGQALFSVMTDRYNTRTIVERHQLETTEHIELPSIAAIDLTKVLDYTTTSTELELEQFEIIIVEENELVKNEMQTMRDFVVTQEQPVFYYFNQEAQDEAKLHLPVYVDPATLIAYEMISLKSINYNDTYGDVEAVFSFPTRFPDGSIVITFLGLPEVGVDLNNDGYDDMKWYPMRTSISNDQIHITFRQLSLKYMGETDALLIVIGEPQQPDPD